MSSRRAVWRWGWRLLRKEWREQTLIIGLVLGIVTLSIGTSVLAHNLTPPQGGLSNVEGVTIRGGADQVAQAEELLGSRAGVMDQGEARPAGATDVVDLVALDLEHPETRDLIDLRAGTYPVGPNEIAVTDGAGAFLAAEIGDSVQLDDSVLTITGIIEDPTDLSREFVFFDVTNPPPLKTRRSYVTFQNPELVELEKLDVKVEGFGFGGGDEQRRSDTNILSAIFTTLAMMLVGLIASAAFAVAGRRRIRQYGLLGAIGANERHLRGAAAFNGFAVGILAALAGAILGLAAAAATLPLLENALNHRVRYQVPVILVAAIALLAVVMSTLAAWWPARSIARQPTTEALAARRPQARPVRNTTLIGAVVTIGGYFLLARTLESDEPSPLPSILGIVMTIVGVILLTPAAISIIGALSRRAGLPVRIAGRDLSRFQSRSAAALGAVVLALAIPLGVGIVSSQSDARNDTGPTNLPEDTAIVWSLSFGDRDDNDGNVPVNLDSFDTTDLRDEIVAALPSVDVAAIEVLVDTRQESYPNGRGEVLARTRHLRMDEPCSRDNEEDDEGRCFALVRPWVATPELAALRSIDMPSADVDLIALAAGQWGDWSDIDEDVTPLRSTVTALPRYSSFPQVLISETSIRPTDKRVTIGWLLTSPKPLTADETSTLRSTMRRGAEVETLTSPNDAGSTRIITALVGMLVGFAILAATVTLIRSESADDNKILNALGASSPMRRSIAASTAAMLALGGAVLAIPIGIIGLIIDRADQGAEGYPYAVPWSTLLILFAIFPMLAAIGSGILAPNTKELR